jgi:hypothetical protein
MAHFTANPLPGALRITGHTPTVSADATVEPTPGALRATGHTTDVEAYLDEIDRLAQAALSICPASDPRHKVLLAIRAARCSGRPEDTTRNSALLVLAQQHRKPDGTANISKIHRLTGASRTHIRSVLRGGGH